MLESPNGAIEVNAATKAVASVFSENLKSVQQLVDFDRAVLDSAILNLQALKDKLDAKHPAIADRVGNTLNALRTTREHDSMRKHYSTIYNQCIVLLVSHFGSTLHSLFTRLAPLMVGAIGDKDAAKEEFKVTLAELRDLNFDLRDEIGELLVAKRDISFQDMQTASRAFRTYLGVDLPTGEGMNNVVFAQAARHVIVHKGGRVDDRFLRQVRDFSDRTVKPVLKQGESLAFGPGEVEKISADMSAFVTDLCGRLVKRGS